MEKEFAQKDEKKESELLGPITTMKEEHLKRKEIIENLPELERADIIYIFIPSKEMGIKFYSRSPRSALETGVFETDQHSISVAEWNDNINSENGPEVSRLIGGEVVTCTYIVSEENYIRIINDIMSQKESEKITINITHNKLMEKPNDLNNTNNHKAELAKMKEELLNRISNNISEQKLDDKMKYEQFMDENNQINKIIK